MDYLKNLYFVKKSEETAKILSQNLLISNVYNLRFCVNNKFKSKSSICKEIFSNSLHKRLHVIYNRIIVENFETMKSDQFPDVNFYLLKNSLDDSTLLIFDYIDDALLDLFNKSKDKYQTIHELQKVRF